ncbi:hypothetical protein Kisp01_70410 [Kineosporia sp. NBRC 101677]|nr:hypothetical protein Kisp01_70410 [Kineosporia sp. NBRC 101677]
MSGSLQIVLVQERIGGQIAQQAHAVASRRARRAHLHDAGADPVRGGRRALGSRALKDLCLACFMMSSKEWVNDKSRPGGSGAARCGGDRKGRW